MEPEFCAPGDEAGGPLADLHLSRDPLRFSAGEADTVILDSAASSTLVLAQGSRVEGRHKFSATEIDDGVVLELGGSVVLLLHRFELSPETPQRFDLVGDSSVMVRLRQEIERVADLEVPALLRGETGTGKELVASAIHWASRRPGSFLAVNLGAIPASLASSELFGASKGAFTGASRRQAGYFERARGGTLFLDEIGEASGEVQAMLLRVLESREIQPVGAQEPRSVDVRVVAATDADLEAAAAAGSFRPALLHRLAGYEIHLPALRRRRDDIGRLLVHFLRLELDVIGEAGRLDTVSPEPWLPASLVARLTQLEWPGNVRQLRNVARQLAISSRGQPRVEIGPQIERLLGMARPNDTSPETKNRASGTRRRTRRKIAEISDEEIAAALQDARWDLKATARMLRISRTSLYVLLEKHPDFRVPSQIDDDEIVRCQDQCGGDFEVMIERLGISQRALKRRLNELGL